MVVASMSLEEKLAHVRVDYASIMRKYDRIITQLRHTIKASRDKHPRIHQSEYFSPRRIEWVVTVRSTKKQDHVFMSAWWQLAGVGVEAFTLAPNAAFYFDTHFFQRYRVRESEIKAVAENIKGFLRTNYDVTTKRLDTYRHGLQEAAGVAAEGLFVGTVRPGNIIACDTFLSNEMLREDQQALQRELHFHAHTKHWPAARMQQFGRWLDEKLGELGEE
ncbi:MAG: hypothetical protein IPI81_03945 [Flavobacteriales bacterium]|nr:hypothetical protein [Flavobacteriales bacterium]MCC6937612.1 hypothetical protein [Flavobacteriales bacterium]